MFLHQGTHNHMKTEYSNYWGTMVFRFFDPYISGKFRKTEYFQMEWITRYCFSGSLLETHLEQYGESGTSHNTKGTWTGVYRDKETNMLAIVISERLQTHLLNNEALYIPIKGVLHSS